MYVSIIPTPFFTQNLIYHKHFPHCLFLLKIYPGDHFIDVYKEMLLIPFCTCKILSIFYRGVIVYIASSLLISSFQSLNHVWFFATPCTEACQASMSFTISQSPLKLMSIELVMPSNYLILCHLLLLLPLIFLTIRAFSNESVLCIRWPQYWSFSFSISPSNEYSGFPLRLTGLISLQSKGISRVFSKITVQKHQFFGAQPSLWFNSHIHTWLLEKL